MGHEKPSYFVSQSESSTKKPFNFVSQSESSITSPESTRLGWRFLLGWTRLAIAYLNTYGPPPPVSSPHSSTTLDNTQKKQIRIFLFEKSSHRKAENIAVKCYNWTVPRRSKFKTVTVVGFKPGLSLSDPGLFRLTPRLKMSSGTPEN